MKTLAIAFLLVHVGTVQAAEVVVFAAASLKTALDDVVLGYEEASSDDIVVSYAGTPALARQIEQGAPADLFISANVAWMDELEAQGLLAEGTRQSLLSNRLVLVTSSDVQLAGGDITSDALRPLVAAAETGSPALAMGFVEAVPAGIYGRGALEALGVWDSVASSVVETENVRAALALVARGEVPFGIVYASDALADKSVGVVGTFPAESHPPILYPVALLNDADEAARGFLNYLIQPAATRIFEANGFTRP